MESKSHDEKIFITDFAASKVGRIKIPGFTDLLNDELQRHHKELLTKAKNENNSNEVLRMWNIYTGKHVDTLGFEKYVSPSMNPEAVVFLYKASPLSLGYLHNHTTTATFSYDDVETFITDRRISIMTVVTSLGGIYTLYKNENYDFDKAMEIFNKTVAKLGGAGAKIGEVFVKEFAKKSRKGGVEYGKR